VGRLRSRKGRVLLISRSLITRCGSSNSQWKVLEKGMGVSQKKGKAAGEDEEGSSGGASDKSRTIPKNSQRRHVAEPSGDANPSLKKKFRLANIIVGGGDVNRKALHDAGLWTLKSSHVGGGGEKSSGGEAVSKLYSGAFTQADRIGGGKKKRVP